MAEHRPPPRPPRRVARRPRRDAPTGSPFPGNTPPGGPPSAPPLPGARTGAPPVRPASGRRPESRTETRAATHTEPRTEPPRDEQTVYGVKAALAVLERRPADVRRIFHGPALRPLLGAHLAAAAARRLPYRELPPEELARVAGSPHHEGLVVVAAPLRYRAPHPASAHPPVRAHDGRAALWLALDRVENPHNLGALVRTAAFFGLTGLLVGGAAPGEKVNSAVLRVAEGGAEHVPLVGAGVQPQALPQALGLLREAGARVLGLETDGTHTLGEALAGVAPGAPLVLVLGHEGEGLSAPVRRACDALCVLRGAGPLPSLNVAVAAAVALGEALRGRPAPAPFPAEPPPDRRGENTRRAPRGRGGRPASNR